MTSKKVKYTGILNKPISPAGGLLSAELIRIEQCKRIEALFSHFKIDKNDPGSWGLLALELALRHVPGMTIRKAQRAGRPQAWDIEKMQRLVRAVEDTQRNRSSDLPHLSVAEAIRAIKKNDHSLRNATERRYYMAKETIAEAERLKAEWSDLLTSVLKSKD